MASISRRLSILVIAVASLFFQPTISFVLPKATVAANLQIDASTDVNHEGDDDVSQISKKHDWMDSFQSPIDRRQGITRMSLAVPVLWAFPEMAFASSSATKQAKPIDLPIDFELSAAVQKLFDLDDNKLIPGKDYAIDVQGKASGEDAAPKPLFQYVDPEIFQRPTYQRFVALLDNYEANVCLEEDNTKDETEEAYAFLRACMAAPVMRYCYSYCKKELAKIQEEKAAKRYSYDTEDEFVQLLYKIWFTTYSRSKGCDKNSDINSDNDIDREEQSGKTVNGSSGFEHVFVGEIRKKKVIGFHNWIQLYRQEQAGNVDYRGTKKSSSTSRVLTYNLRWKGYEKPVGGSLLGVSPEFELALYTMLFLAGNKDNILLLSLGDGILTKLDVKCFRTKGRVGTCYVESLS